MSGSTQTLFVLAHAAADLLVEQIEGRQYQMADGTVVLFATVTARGFNAVMDGVKVLRAIEGPSEWDEKGEIHPEFDALLNEIGRQFPAPPNSRGAGRRSQ